MPRLIDNEADRLNRRLTFNTTREQETALRELAREKSQPFGTLLRIMLGEYLRAESDKHLRMVKDAVSETFGKGAGK